MKVAALLAALLFLAGCATPYQEIGTDNRGGFYTERLSDNRFAISFSANGFTAPVRARDFCMLRAAETTIEYGYSYFTVDGQRNLSTVTQVDMGTTTTTNGYVGPSGGFSATSTSTNTEIPVFKPGTRYFISCYEQMPNGQHTGRIFNAQKTVDTLKAKYGIKS